MTRVYRSTWISDFRLGGRDFAAGRATLQCLFGLLPAAGEAGVMSGAASEFCCETPPHLLQALLHPFTFNACCMMPLSCRPNCRKSHRETTLAWKEHAANRTLAGTMLQALRLHDQCRRKHQQTVRLSGGGLGECKFRKCVQSFRKTGQTDILHSLFCSTFCRYSCLNRMLLRLQLELSSWASM